MVTELLLVIRNNFKDDLKLLSVINRSDKTYVVTSKEHNHIIQKSIPGSISFNSGLHRNERRKIEINENADTDILRMLSRLWRPCIEGKTNVVFISLVRR